VASYGTVFRDKLCLADSTPGKVKDEPLPTVPFMFYYQGMFVAATGAAHPLPLPKTGRGI